MNNLSLVYRWYNYSMDDEICNHVKYTIEHRDFDTFMDYYNALSEENICYLPQDALIYCDREKIGQVSILNRAAFSLITFSECEHN